jgi:hypothetical protein
LYPKSHLLFVVLVVLGFELGASNFLASTLPRWANILSSLIVSPFSELVIPSAYWMHCLTSFVLVFLRICWTLLSVYFCFRILATMIFYDITSNYITFCIYQYSWKLRSMRCTNRLTLHVACIRWLPGPLGILRFTE